MNKFPSKVLFAKRMDTLAWSKKSDSPYSEDKLKEKIKIVFNLLEEYYSKYDIIYDFSIEHIFTDDGSDENSKIGNLLPLETELKIIVEIKL